MNSISRILTATGSMMVVCVVLALGTSAVAQEPIQGSWIFTLSSSSGGGPPFTAVASFAAGGVFVATGQNDPERWAAHSTTLCRSFTVDGKESEETATVLLHTSSLLIRRPGRLLGCSKPIRSFGSQAGILWKAPPT
jgi:hypothetical protein